MVDILEYVERHIDEEDLEQCIETNQESEKFKEMGSFMDTMMEDFDIHYLYIIIPKEKGEQREMINVFSADTAIGRETDPDGYYLGMVLDEVYEDYDMETFLKAFQNDEISFFKNFSIWGYDYTATKPLVNNNGKHFALLCVDIEVDDIRLTILTYTILVIGLTIILGVVFMLGAMIWMRRRVTTPIKKLEYCVVSYTMRSHLNINPELVEYEDPHITDNNEIGLLADSIKQLTYDMQAYIRSSIDLKDRF